MVEFGDELLTIESYRIPWLIWIQLLVVILLILVLFHGFSLLASDGTSDASTSSVVKEEERNGRRTEYLNGEEEEEEAINNGDEEESSSLKNSINLGFFRVPTHPCDYIRLMKLAFFKCFGLGLDSRGGGAGNPATDYRHDKQD